MSKKTIIGIVILVVAVLLLIGAQLMMPDAQRMYQQFGADAARRLEDSKTFTSILSIFGYAIGAVGLVLLGVGLLEKKKET